MEERPGETRRPGGFAIRRARFAAGFALLVERAWPPVFALGVVLALFAILSWFGVFHRLPDLVRLALLIAFALAGLLILSRHRHLRLPRRDEIVRRVEEASGLAHQPLAVQLQRPVGDDSFAHVLFAAHQRRMLDRVGRPRGGSAATRTERLDPLGLRALLAMVLATGFAFSFGPGGGRLGDAFQPIANSPLAPARIDAWVTPPGYTGAAPVFLQSDAEPRTVPEGSVLSVRVSDRSGLAVGFQPTGAADREAVSPLANDGEASEGAAEYALTLERSGTAEIASRLRTLATWQFVVLPDLAPAVRFDGEPEEARNGALRFSYVVSDDYGVVDARAKVEALDRAPGARPLVDAPEIRVQLPRRTAGEARATTSAHLVESPWAGARARMTLLVRDDRGQTGRSEPLELQLPERNFTNPLARAVVEQRRMLALDAGSAGQVVRMLDAVMLRGDEFIENGSHFLALAVARSMIRSADGDAALLEAVDLLWETALAIEDGEMAFAEERLREAQEALAEALETGASPERIAELMDELREAMNDYMREMAEAMRNMPPASQSELGDAQEVRPQDLERMLDRIEDLAEAGSPEAARELLAELQAMMDNLATRQARQQGESGPQSEAQQQMNELGELLQEQQALMDRTFALEREDARRQRGESEAGASADGEPMTAEEIGQAMRALEAEQQRLRERLEALEEGMAQSGMEPGEGLGEAAEAMDGASGALGRGEGGEAVGRQGEALEALRRGAGEMMSRMQAQQGEDGQGGGGFGEGRENANRDPLGRDRSAPGRDFGEDVDVPDEIETQRARRILDEIRNRLGDQLSPRLEREYLERLLSTP